jgi:hypothetical protein
MFRSDEMSISRGPRVASSTPYLPSKPSLLSDVWSRTTSWTVATAKRVLPAVLVLTICAAALAATIALRLAIWLPMYRH